MKKDTPRPLSLRFHFQLIKISVEVLDMIIIQDLIGSMVGDSYEF